MNNCGWLQASVPFAVVAALMAACSVETATPHALGAGTTQPRAVCAMNLSANARPIKLQDFAHPSKGGNTSPDGGTSNGGGTPVDGGTTTPAVDGGAPAFDGGTCTCDTHVVVTVAPNLPLIGASFVPKNPDEIAALPACPDAGANKTPDEICVSDTSLRNVSWSPAGAQTGTASSLMAVAVSPSTDLGVYAVDVAMVLSFDAGTQPGPNGSCGTRTVDDLFCRTAAALPLPGLDRAHNDGTPAPSFIPSPTDDDVSSTANMQAYIDTNIGKLVLPYSNPDLVQVGDPNHLVSITHMSRGNALMVLVSALQSKVRAYAEMTGMPAAIVRDQRVRDELYQSEATMGGVLAGPSGDSKANVTATVKAALGACGLPSLPDSGFYAGFMPWSTFVTVSRAMANDGNPDSQPRLLQIASLTNAAPNGAFIDGPSNGLPFATKIPFNSRYGSDAATNFKCFWAQSDATCNGSTTVAACVQDPTQCSQCM